MLLVIQALHALPFTGNSASCIFLTGHSTVLLFSLRESSLTALTTSFLQMTPKSSNVLLGKSDDLSELKIPRLYNMDGLIDFLMSLAFLKFSGSTNYRDVNS